MQNMNMSDLFGKMQKIQQKMQEAQEELASVTTTAEAGGGMVKVTANGKKEITGIEIEPDVIDPDDKEMLEDLIIAGVNKALEQADEMAQEKMSEATGNMLPPGFDMSQLGL